MPGSSPVTPSDPTGPDTTTGSARGTATSDSTDRSPKRRRADRPAAVPRWLRILLPAVLTVVWLAVFAIGGMGFGTLSDITTQERSAFLPETAESTAVQDRLPEFQGEEGAPAIVLAQRDGGLTEDDLAGLETFSERADDVLRGLDADAVPDDLTVSPPIPSDDGEAAQVVVIVPDDLELTDAVDALTAEVQADVPDDVGTWVTGPAGFSADLSAAFAGIDGLLLIVAVVAVFIILVLVYRSPLLPIIVLLSAMTALCAAVLAVIALARADLVTVDGQVQGILFILVIGAATDYSLLFVARCREALRDHERPFTAVLAAAKGTVEPILASGGTVIAGLLCLMLSDLGSNAALGPVATVGILAAMVTSLTFLPAMIALLGRIAFWPRVPRHGDAHPELVGEKATGLWPGIGKKVAAAPKRIAAAVLIFLILGCAGLVQLRADGVPASEFVLGESQARDGQAVLDEHFPGGTGDPAYILAPEGERADVAAAILEVDGVDSLALASEDSPAGSIEVDESGQAQGEGPMAEAEPTVADGDILFEATLSDPADSAAAEQTVDALRAATGDDVLVGGSTAVDLDTNRTSVADRNLIIPIVLVVITVMLALLLRSIVAPVVLLATTVLSFGTALGIAAVIFDLIGFTGSDPTVPLYAFVFLVALGIDYNIFLMTRVREESLIHGTHEGTLRALSLTGGVITSAGVVLAATFAALAVIPIQFLVQLAIIVSLGVLIDALIVRSFLVPALCRIIGNRIWWPATVPRPGASAQQSPAVAQPDPVPASPADGERGSGSSRSLP
ncbi:MAG: efflux RND transporter permease subunit [Brachybacterium sp.]|nr:efflux RND transporter permease subunit [Brachybacterium sp.]